MGKPVAGEVVVLPFPQTDLHAGKRRPALVVADSGGDDVVLCQITSQPHPGPFSLPLGAADFEQGKLTANSYIRVNRLFTVDQSVIAYSAARLKRARMDEVKAKLRQLFS